jgi:membrane fusion protein (multidrug efflux system)
MTPPAAASAGRSWRGVFRKSLLAVVFLLGLGALFLALAGVFHAKVPQTPAPLPDSRLARPDLRLAEVRLLRRPRLETAVGTVRPVHEAAVASKLLAKVVEVRVKAGQAVTQGEVLVRLDDADLRARLQQAQATLAAARSAYDQAQADQRRAQRLLAGKAISPAEYDKFATALRTAQAEVQRAQQAVQEAQVLLDYATIRAPLSGIVVDKRVSVGDTVQPGQVLLTLYDPAHMQMIVSVRESLAQRLRVGQKLRGRLDALHYECEATVSEIVPEAQTSSRSFLVKVTGPCPPGVHSGMFGRLFIPLDEEEVLVVPAAAVHQVGQLDLVDVVVNQQVQRRLVQLGQRQDGNYEVLAGLRAGEKVVLPPE